MATFELVQQLLSILLAVVFVGMGTTHFLPATAQTMAQMIPPALRFTGVFRPENLVAFTGVCEILGGLGLLLESTRFAAAVALVLFLIAVFPANSHAAAHPERFGRAAIPFWPRYFGQLAIIALLLTLLV